MDERGRQIDSNGAVYDSDSQIAPPRVRPRVQSATRVGLASTNKKRHRPPEGSGAVCVFSVIQMPTPKGTLPKHALHPQRHAALR